MKHFETKIKICTIRYTIKVKKKIVLLLSLDKHSLYYSAKKAAKFNNVISND